MTKRRRPVFPHYAELVQTIDGVAIRQVVEVVEKFHNRFRIRAIAPLRVKWIPSYLPRGRTTCVRADQIQPIEFHG